MWKMTELTDRQKWLQWRKGGIGSSDVPIIMGVSRFKTPLQLYQEKISEDLTEDESNAFIKNAGNQAETKIRAFFEAMNNEDFEACLVENVDYPFMRASLDGRSASKKHIVEIKLIGNGGQDAKEEDKKFDNARKGTVPIDYYPQIQHQLLVSGAESCYFLCYLYDKDDMFLKNAMTMDKFCMIEVKPDKDYQDKMLAKCAMFWNCVTSKTPPDLSKGDAFKITGLTKEVNKMKAIQEKIATLSADYIAFKNGIESAANESGADYVLIGSVSLKKQNNQWEWSNNK